MKRIPIKLGVFLLLAVACALALLWWTGPTHRITRLMHARIQAGMTLAEVEAILGCRPGTYFAGPAAIKIEGQIDEVGNDLWLICENENQIARVVLDNPHEHHHYVWITCTGVVQVYCGPEQRVVYSSFYEVVPSSLHQRIQLWSLYVTD